MSKTEALSTETLMVSAVEKLDEATKAMIAATSNGHSLRDELNHDDLTGILNRRGFDQRITLWQTEEMDHVTVAIMDLDDFKQVNDTHGHQAGDELLIRTATLLRTLARSRGGYAARLGGDEFVVAVPLADPTLGDVLSSGMHGVCELSIGVAMGSMSQTPKLMQKADLAMYCAKNSGEDGFQYWELDTVNPPVPSGRRHRKR